MAALGTWKDANDVEIRSRRRVKVAIALALTLDIVQVVLLLMGTGPFLMIQFIYLIRFRQTRIIHNLLHGVLHLPLARVLALFPLLTALFSPRVVYLSMQSHGYAEEANETALMSQHGPCDPRCQACESQTRSAVLRLVVNST
jgi:ATP-binding cassette subfamily B (MDR/TAP) protein 6